MNTDGNLYFPNLSLLYMSKYLGWYSMELEMGFNGSCRGYLGYLGYLGRWMHLPVLLHIDTTHRNGYKLGMDTEFRGVCSE